MHRLDGRVQKLETAQTQAETIIDVVFVTPFGQELDEEALMKYPPVEEQIAEQRAAGAKVIMVYSYREYDEALDGEKTVTSVSAIKPNKNEIGG
ncbi:hypothetical protein KP005_19350 [Geomonas nitrogeniifigens]|uniref:Uncharacterized protein n=1 Tax=Geomonas diazotrophica TaxID=2843197 RepID=A0ABX8JLG3_9BACT|nr:hypothetical protein [Geomonas nitrogeniifigens]QWV97464.1 hypothetical protein KP005_19350 [Geomonas nitrogeniifigens]